MTHLYFSVTVCQLSLVTFMASIPKAAVAATAPCIDRGWYQSSQQVSTWLQNTAAPIYSTQTDLASICFTVAAVHADRQRFVEVRVGVNRPMVGDLPPDRVGNPICATLAMVTRVHCCRLLCMQLQRGGIWCHHGRGINSAAY